MEITFYYAPKSSAVPVASALAELGVPHRRVELDLFGARDQKQPDFLAINPVGRVPALTVDGKPMFEALAIMQWLGERFGVDEGLWPAAGTQDAMVAHTWAAWAYVSYGAAVHKLFLATSDQSPLASTGDARTPWADVARAECQLQLGALDPHLAQTGFVVGDRFSLADVIVSGVVLWSRFVGVSLSDFPHVAKWADACMQRPAIRQEFGG